MIDRLIHLGFLRLALLSLALVNALIPPLDSLLRQGQPAPGWEVVPAIINPVMAPIFIVVIIFDIVMAKVRAADAPPDEAGYFRFAVRVDVTVIFLTLLFWVPFFNALF